MIKRGLSQHLKLKVPKKQKSRQMMDDGRVSLSKMVFGNREQSMSEYWMNATDTKAKLLTANIAGGLALAGYYGYNHFSNNPEVRGSDSASRQKAIPKGLEEMGSEFAMHREGKVKAHSYGLARRNSMKKSSGSQEEIVDKAVKIYRRNSMKKAGKGGGGKGSGGGGGGKTKKDGGSGGGGENAAAAAAVVAATGATIVRRDSQPPDDSDIDGGFFHVDGTDVGINAMDEHEASEHFPEFGSDSAPKQTKAAVGLIRRDSEPPDDSSFDEWHFKVDDTPLYDSDLTPEELVAKQAEARKLEIQQNTLVRRDSMPPDDSDIDGGFFRVDGTFVEATSGTPVKSDSPEEDQPGLEIASPVTAALHRHLSQLTEKTPNTGETNAANAAAVQAKVDSSKKNSKPIKAKISRRMSISEKKQRETEAKQKAKRLAEKEKKAKRRASKSKAKETKKAKSVNPDWKKSVDRAKAQLGTGDGNWVQQAVGSPPVHSETVPNAIIKSDKTRTKSKEDEPTEDEPKEETPEKDEPTEDEPKAETPEKDEPTEDEPKAETPEKDKPEDDSHAEKEDQKATKKSTKKTKNSEKKAEKKTKKAEKKTKNTEKKASTKANVAESNHLSSDKHAHLSFRSLSRNPNLKTNEKDEAYIKHVTTLVRSESEKMKAREAIDDEEEYDEAARIFLPSGSMCIL